MIKKTKAPIKEEIKKVLWSDVREQVHKVNPELAQIIDQLSTSKKYPLYKARYPFGFESVQGGKFLMLDRENKIASIRDDLDYNIGSHPCGIVLKNCLEFFISIGDRIISYGLIHAGSIFGTWIILNPNTSQHPAFLWNISAGARSLVMLPKISVANKWAALKKYLGSDIDIPKKILDHGKSFQQIGLSDNFGEDWNAEVLYFSKKWFENLNDKSWTSFANYLYRKTWEKSEFWRNDIILSIILS